jgi:Tol biopolymer transport system component
MTADGRYIVFTSDRLGRNKEHVFRMDADGSNQKQLTAGIREWSPRLSPDGQWVYYVSAAPMNICKISIDGGEPTIIRKYEGASFIIQIDVSPRDGMVAYEEAKVYKGERKIVILAADGAEITTLTLPLTASLGAFHWTPDGRAIAFVNSHLEGANIWTMAIDGKGSKELTNFKTEAVPDFSWFPDGKQLALIRGTYVADAVLISEAK